MTRLFKFTAPLFAVAAMLALVAATQAAKNHPPATSASATPIIDATNGVTLDGVDLGKHVYGPKIKADDLKGKVVVFEYWGDRCPPCIRSIPHLVKVQKKHGANKLTIVANQVWTNDVDAAKKAWTNAGGDDTITVANHGKLKGAKVNGVPHSFVFDHTGKLVWEGHPLDKQFDKAIEKAVKALPTKA